MGFRLLCLIGAGLALAGCTDDDVDVDEPGQEVPIVWDELLPPVGASDLRVDRLGEIALGDDGQSERFTVTVDADASTLFVIMNSSRVDGLLVLTEATSPSGTLVIGDGAGGPATDVYFGGFEVEGTSSIKQVPHAKRAAVMISNTPEVALEAGEWSFRVGQYREGIAREPLPATVEVATVAHTRAPVLSGTINLAFVLDPRSGLTAATAPSSALVTGSVARIDALFAPTGVTVGEVAYLDSPAPLEAPLPLSPGPCVGSEAMNQAFTGLGAPAGFIPILITDRMSCTRAGGDVGSVLAGVSNGLPGLPLAAADGVVVANHLYAGNEVAYEYVLAHELGHFLGLFHTEEAITGYYDNVADTPNSDAARNYLMHASVNPGQDLVSADQGLILRSSPWVHAAP